MPDQKHSAGDDGIVTVRIGREAYAVESSARGHAWAGDEPGWLGGADTGPSPYEMLLSSLGACKAITAKMYADRKGWALEGVRVVLRHERPHGPRGPEVIHADLWFEGDLDDDQRARLLEIAEKCPVQKTITGELTVVASAGA